MEIVFSEGVAVGDEEGSLNLSNSSAQTCNSKTNLAIHDLSAQSLLCDRLVALFGTDGIERSAMALRCTGQRFRNRNQQEILVAIVEGLEALAAGDIPRSQWPGRWSCNGAVCERLPLREVWVSLIGRGRLAARVAYAVHRRPEVVAAAFKDPQNRTAIDLTALAEILSLLRARELAWSARWLSIPTHVSTRRSGHCEVVDAEEVTERLAHVLPGKFPRARLARAIGKDSDSVGRWMNQRRDSHGRAARIPVHVLVIVELLEVLRREGVPSERWPSRWRG